MSKLGLLDQVFRSLESNGLTPIIMGGAMIFDPSTSPYPLNGKILADHLAARLERIPIMRKKLVQDRLKIGNLQLVEDPDFNVKNHITVTSLPAPGGYAELTACLEDFSAQPLEMDRPLWHYEVIEGLEGGRIAVATHIHHIILDGVGAVKALGSVWDLEPTPPERPVGRHWEVDEVPTPFELIREAILENAERLYLKAPNFLIKHGTPLLRTAINAIKSRIDIEEEDDRKKDKTPAVKVERTSINVARISSKRSVSYLDFSLAEVKAMTREFGCSVNDLMLLLSSCALDNYFKKIGEKIELDQVAGMPISLRPDDSEDAVGNVLTVARVNLHTRTRSLLQRLELIAEQTRAVKSNTKPAKSTGKKAKIDQMELLGLFSPIVVEALLFTAIKFNLLEKKALVNVGITNVPGSPIPIYLSGAKIVSSVPMAPAIDTIGLTICISSMGDILSMGFHGCGEAIVDKDALTAGARKGFESLKRRMKTGTPAKVKAVPKAQPKKATTKSRPKKAAAPKAKAVAKPVKSKGTTHKVQAGRGRVANSGTGARKAPPRTPLGNATRKSKTK
jgi:diacylglycerol O-acyltransferase / wax synthase